MDDTALINHGPGVARSVSEIPLVGSISRVPSSLSSATLSPPREPAAASNPSGGPATVGLDGTTSRLSASPPPHPRPSAPLATATPTRSAEDVSKLDLAIMGCTIGLVVPVALNIKDLTSTWYAPWKELYGVLTIVSLTSTVTGFFTAWCPAVSWGRRLSPSCARLGLVDASALFIVFLACKLGHLGCAAGAAAAAAVVLVLVVVWAWSEQRQPAIAGADEVAAMVVVVQQGAGLPHDAP